MSQVILSVRDKSGTSLFESSLPVWGCGEAVMSSLRSMWKYFHAAHNQSTLIELSKHSYDLRWYRRGNKIVVQM